MRRTQLPEYFTREIFIYGALIAVLVLIILKLVWLQVFQAANLRIKGSERIVSEQRLTAKRGTIYDSNNHVLAQSVRVKEVYADPKTLNDYITRGIWKESKEQLVAKLADILGKEKAEIQKKLDSNVSWVSIAHQVDLDKAAEIMSWRVPGIGVSDEAKRVYPMGTVAASVLGIVNMAGQGVEGVEAFYNNELLGKSINGTADVVRNSDNVNNPAQTGANIVLTIDLAIQHLLEQQCDELAATTKAKSITILAMDPMSGRIIGMASRPNYDPNNYYSSTPEQRRNTAISMSYEPGSTFKIITGAAALEEVVIGTDELFQDSGYLKVGPRVITNWDSDYRPHGMITFARGMELSSNVVLAQVGQKLGKDLFYTYLKAFGFGQKTGIDIAGEENGLLVPLEKVRDVELATMSFGQTNLVTPLQLLTAVCAIANGGTLYRPYVVEKIISAEGNLIRENKPTPVRQVLSKDTARQMSAILKRVVDYGTGQLALIPGIEVAGKTGTAQKVDPKTGEYSTTDFIASFVAYAPVDNPKIAVLIVIDSPQGEHQGGVLAAPRAKVIIDGAMHYYNIPAAQDIEGVVDLPAGEKARPTPSEIVPERELYKGETVVPDLNGLTIRQAGECLAKADLLFNFTGTGLAIEQKPAPGKVVPRGTSVDVRFSPLTQD